jgi:cytochrome c peroxidase
MHILPTPAAHAASLRVLLVLAAGVAVGLVAAPRVQGGVVSEPAQAPDLDARLRAVLRGAGFTGRVESTLPARLGRPVNTRLANVGRLLFFDKVLGLHNDNSCAGCHAPKNGLGDSQPMAIGVQNNNVVGPHRRGPRNQRRSPSVVNTIFYPALMWTPRFVALSGNPFNSPQGFKFPPPEGIITGERTLLAAQASLPVTELVEAAGFNGITENPGPFTERHFIFDDGRGQVLPAPDATGFHNFPIQAAVDARLNAIEDYLELFGEVFNYGRPLPPGGITISMRRRAIAEFQTSITAANAPLDRYARGVTTAMTAAQKRGALVFFEKARCVSCHAVAGNANEMFSDFRAHRIGGPQVFPAFGVGTGNVIFDGPGENEDFGFAQTEGDDALRYKFRTAPLRNLKVARAFFHNGAFGTLEAAIRHHLDVSRSLRNYSRTQNNLPADLRVGPFRPILAAGIDPLLRRPIELTAQELSDLVTFVRDGLFDPRVANLCRLIPERVPSGMSLQVFEGCPTDDDDDRPLGVPVQ